MPLLFLPQLIVAMKTTIFHSEEKAMAKKINITIIEDDSFWKFTDRGFNTMPDLVPDGIIYETERGIKLVRSKTEYEALAVPS